MNAIIDAFEGGEVTYDPAGSGAGTDCALDGSCDMGAGDVTIPSDQWAEGILHIPAMVGAIAVGHSAPGVSVLNISACALAGIYTGAITSWGDDIIVADNPELAGSTLAVNAVGRSDSSGSTAVITGYLSEACPDVWTTGISKLPEWSDAITGVDGTSAVLEAVRGTEGSIGYAAFGRFDAEEEAALEHADGSFFQPSNSETFGALSDQELPAPGEDWGAVEFNFDADGFPTEFVAFFFVKADASADVKSFVEFVLSEDVQASLPDSSFRPLPDNLLEIANAGAALITPA